jgi:hypothetical protein
MDEQQRQAFEAAVEDKKAAAKEASERTAEHPPTGAGGVKLDATGQAEPGLQTDDRGNQDVFSVRDKNSGHGKKTADKWNQ